MCPMAVRTIAMRTTFLDPYFWTIGPVGSPVNKYYVLPFAYVLMIFFNNQDVSW